MENRYTDSVKNAWKFAAEEASKLGSEYVGTEHLLIGISNEKDSVGGKILNSLGLTVTALEEFLQAYNDSVFFRNTDLYIAPRTKRVLEMAVEEANELGNNYVGTEHLLLAIIHEGGGLAIRILEQFNVTGGKLKRAFEQFMSEENDSEKNENLGDLGEFAVDLNERAKQGKIDPVVGRQTEINRVIQILSRRNKNNPVLIGEPGVGKTAIAEGLAQRIINNDVPEILKNCRIISLNMSSVVAGTKYRGEFEERLKKVLEEVKKHENWILFIDELHTLVGAGAGEGSMDAANIMKPALARGEIRCIGATTLKEYKKYIATRQYPSISYEIGAKISELTGQEVRVAVPGHMQRGGSPCPYDRVLSTRLGAAAGKMILDGEFGYLVGMKNNHIAKIPLADVAGKLKMIQPDDEMVQEAKLMGISFGD